ncbi:multidrug efflux pump subunit AcrB [Dyadobacter sp. BE34]|uniref:Multidrug efflux pump subunit AcrB n=1 Tax=Dyadobacter fermentans TaxID=94254 RepID=A0ABU1R889_9BACT|nr:MULTISPECIES: efflux RND transporter permease subunit [Dyadobacter]MDR6809611.1 multidrug efflux pump subunit AcrB [Dyadobacter fermentans]MDR7047289.1 multidrug efflux pump subunit AcrB [Dyadobacter sp. BE242]MDR7201525.1 multidrug efflux pump subunit AcrB [Dyadobacter sp. BE34]MDR7219395.1 multidrug efflux pump subunit AcrB [Dyadobacter sp. BE31]MDR7267211.1 multidrug efflux pump subunit AcrB [Dyadobacter sp. BE32]
MDKLLTGALSKPVMVVVVVLGLAIFSIMALFKIPVDIFPKLNLPTIYIAQPYGGMTPSQMEGFIATRYQNQMLYVSGIKDIEVKNVQGLCLVKLTFYETVDMAQVAGEVANQVSRVMSYMPPGTVPPTVVRFDATNLPVGQLVFTSKRATLNEMQDYASTRIRPLFSQIPGASSPPPFGGNERTVVVRVDPEAMRSYQFSPEEVVQAVVKNNQIAPAGNVRVGDFTYMTPMNSVLGNVEDFLNIPLHKGGGPTVFLRDIASVEDASDVTVGYALVNGKRSVYIPLTKTSDASTMDVVNALKAKLPEMQSLLPDYIQLKYEFDQSVYVINAVESLASEGLIGALLTGLVVFLFLGDLRSSLVVIVTIPISLLAAVLAMNLSGQTINIMTLSGLALAIGILVDQSTVVIENIHQHLEMGKPKARAILDATREVSFPLLLITLCILAVFAPALLMNGVPRGMFMPLSLAVGFSIIASYLFSQTLVPVLSNWWLKNHEHKMPHQKKILNDLSSGAETKMEVYEEKHLEKISGFEKFKLRYLSILDILMKRSALVIPIYLLISFGILTYGYLAIGKDMMPKLDHSRQFQLRLIAPQGLRIERTEQQVIQTINLIKGIVGERNVDITSAFVGMTPSSYGTSALYVFNSGPHEAVLQVNLAEGYKISSLDELKEKIRKKIRQNLPDTRVSFEPIELTDKIMSQGAQTPIEIMVGSKDLPDAKKYADKLTSALSRIPYLRDVRINQPLNYPTFDIQIDRVRAAQFGLSADEISKSLVAATSSSRFTAKNFWLDQKKGFAYQVQVQLPEYLMSSPQDIDNIPLVPGQLRPTLGDVASIKKVTVPGEFDRIGPRRIVTVSANIYKKDLGTAAADVSSAILKAGAPATGTIVELKGMARLLQDTLSSLSSGLALAVVVIFLLLAANYQSFKVSFVVLVTIPAVLAGSITILLLTGSTLNLQSYMGIIMSVGVSVANALLLVTNAETLRIKYKDSAKAARVAGAVRLRPILMTSIAMVVGMVPMASGMSESGEQTAPLGRAVIGGLVASTVAALLILPLVFNAIQRKSSVKSVSLNPEDTESEVYDIDEVFTEKA